MWLILALSCSTPTGRVSPPKPQLRVTAEAPYIRAMPPGAPNTAAFMTLNNSGPDLALVSASATLEGAPVARSVELHTHLMEGGMMRMRQVERIELPSGQTVALEPGSLHVMFIGLSQSLPEGSQVEMQLSFSDQSELLLTVPVQKIEAQ